MGIIKSQSINASIYSYIGVLLGFFTSAIIMPKIMSTDQIGFIKLILAVTGVFSTIFSFGVGQLLFRSFPLFEEDKSKRRALLILALKIALFGSLMGIPFYWFTVAEFFNLDSPTQGIHKDTTFLVLVYLTIVARLFYNSIFGYTRMMNNITIDAFIQNVFHKGGILVIIGLFYLTYIDFQWFTYFYLALFLMFPIIISIYYTIRKDSMGIGDVLSETSAPQKFKKKEYKEFYRLLLFGMLTTLGGSLYLYLDTLMVNYYLGEHEVGIYGTMFLFGMIVIIPARSVKSISISILSRAFKENNTQNIKEIYQKSSITLLIIGGYIFMGVWCNMYSVFAFLPEEFQLGLWVVLLIGIGQLIDMATGVNNELIAASPHYKLNTWFTLLSILVGVGINMLLIPKYGITGAGMATMATILFINVVRLIAVYRIYHLIPFTYKTLVILFILIFITAGIEWIPNHSNALLNLFFKSSLISGVYIPLVYFLRISEDFNSMINGFLAKIGVKSLRKVE